MLSQNSVWMPDPININHLIVLRRVGILTEHICWEKGIIANGNLPFRYYPVVLRATKMPYTPILGMGIRKDKESFYVRAYGQFTHITGALEVYAAFLVCGVLDTENPIGFVIGNTGFQKLTIRNIQQNNNENYPIDKDGITKNMYLIVRREVKKLAPCWVSKTYITGDLDVRGILFDKYEIKCGDPVFSACQLQYKPIYGEFSLEGLRVLYKRRLDGLTSRTKGKIINPNNSIEDWDRSRIISG